MLATVVQTSDRTDPYIDQGKAGGRRLKIIHLGRANKV
jgi:hypothetical protein